MRRLATRLEDCDGSLVVAGDRKGPEEYDLPRTEFLSLAAQEGLPFCLVSLLPTGTYARKNLGYLQAMRRGAAVIYETDDDNTPESTWRLRAKRTPAHTVGVSGWLNVYRFFSDEFIWPRGFPLDLVRQPLTGGELGQLPCTIQEASIQQGLVNRSPDVDAVWRLLLDREASFRDGPSIRPAPGTWCPFNSQSTWWWPEAYALMYLPSFVSFRMTDIWRGLVAQRCLWELGQGLVFHAAEAVQDRNPHNLMRDFEEEVPGYLGNPGIATRLEGLSLQPGAQHVGDNLVACYEALVDGGFVPEREIPLVQAWLTDCADVRER
jgi:hypothetical protein